MAGHRRHLHHSGPGTAPAAVPRRRFLMASAGAGLGLALPAIAAPAAGGTIRLGQSTSLTGPLAELGQAAHEGAAAYFNALNAQGGVNGNKIELVTKDDGYDTRRGVANVQAMINDPSIFALFNCLGTPLVEACLPLLRNSDIPFFAPFTGAALARPKDMRNVLNVRAGYAQEAEQLVQHLYTVGTRKIAVVYQNNSFGKEVFESLQSALEKRKLAPVAVATVENDGGGADVAVRRVLGGEPEAVLLALAGQPTAPVVKGIRAARKSLALYALSVVGLALGALGDDGAGMTVSQIVPLPNNQTVPVSREFMTAWQALGTKRAPSHPALEGYINARVFAEALKRAGRNPTRASFLDAVWHLQQFDLGGFEVSFTDPSRGASRFVELTMVGRGGKFIR